MTTKFHVPEIGTRLLLTENWTFSWFWERRNIDLLKALEEKNLVDETKFQPTNIEVTGWGRHPTIQKYYDKYFNYTYNRNNPRQGYIWPKGDPYCYMMTYPKDSIIIVDRYYIKKGNADFSSVTFRTEKLNLPKFKKKPRFWVKLNDANTINYEVLEESQ